MAVRFWLEHCRMAILKAATLADKWQAAAACFTSPAKFAEKSANAMRPLRLYRPGAISGVHDYHRRVKILASFTIGNLRQIACLDIRAILFRQNDRVRRELGIRRARTYSADCIYRVKLIMLVLLWRIKMIFRLAQHHCSIS